MRRWEELVFLRRLHTSSSSKRAYQSVRERLVSGHQKISTKSQALTVGAHKWVVVWCQTLAAPERPSKAVIEPCEDLESHISVTPGLVTLGSDCKRCFVPVELTNMSDKPVTLPPKTALASTHLATTVNCDHSIFVYLSIWQYTMQWTTMLVTAFKSWKVLLKVGWEKYSHFTACHITAKYGCAIVPLLRLVLILLQLLREYFVQC